MIIKKNFNKGSFHCYYYYYCTQLEYSQSPYITIFHYSSCMYNWIHCKCRTLISYVKLELTL